MAIDDRQNPFDDLGVSGLLTRSDREWLLGEKTYEDGDDARRARLRMRERIRNGLRDFILLVHHLDERDRAQLLRDITTQIPDPDEELRHDELGGLCHAIGFLYTISAEANLPFDELIEVGAYIAVGAGFDDPFAINRVDVTIEDHLSEPVEVALETLREGESLTFIEYNQLLKLLTTDQERLRADTDAVDIDTSALKTDGHYTIEESLILAARTMGTGRFHTLLNQRRLHPQLIEDLPLTPTPDEEGSDF